MDIGGLTATVRVKGLWKLALVAIFGQIVARRGVQVTVTYEA